MPSDTPHEPAGFAPRMPPPAWPRAAHVALWLAPSLRFANTFHGGWDAYGQRAGIWRLMDTLDRLSMRASLALQAGDASRCPDILEACALRDWDLLAWSGERAYPAAHDARVARETLGESAAHTVAGWLAGDAGLDTGSLQHLADAGFSYVSNLHVLDVPRLLPGLSGTLVELPYCEEVSDLRCLVEHGMPAARYAQRIGDQFAQLYSEGARTPCVLGLPLQPALVGSPANLREFEAVLADIARHDKVWLATGREIAYWVVHGRHAVDGTGAAAGAIT